MENQSVLVRGMASFLDSNSCYLGHIQVKSILINCLIMEEQFFWSTDITMYYYANNCVSTKVRMLLQK